MLFAGVGDLLRAVALGDHHHRAAERLEEIDVAVHAASGGRAERTGGVALRGLGRAGVVNRVLLEVVGQAFAGIDALLQLRVGDVAGNDDRALE